MAKGQIRFYYFANDNIYNNFASTSGIDEDYLYVVEEQGKIYKGNKLIAQSGKAAFDVITETLGIINTDVQSNKSRIGVLEGKIDIGENQKLQDLLDNKVDKVNGKGLSEANFTQTEKEKLAGIEVGANKFSISVDNVLDSNSTNPVQNKVIKEALDKKASISLTINGHNLTSSFNLTATEINADSKGTAENLIEEHNEDSAAHNAIQLKIDANTDNIANISGDLTDHTTQKGIHLDTDIKNKITKAEEYVKVNHADKAFTTINVIGDTTTALSADNRADSITLQAGDGVTFASNSSTNTITISSLDGVKNIEKGTNNGTIKVDGTEVAVAGLKSAAFQDSSDILSAAEQKTNELIFNHSGDGTHVTPDQKDAWTNAASQISQHEDKTGIHVENGEKSKWNEAYAHSQTPHANVNAQANIIETIKVNNTTLTPSNKTVNITVPTQASDINASPSNHNHDDKYDAKGSASTALDNAIAYTDEAVENLDDSFVELLLYMYGDDITEDGNITTIRTIAFDEASKVQSNLDTHASTTSLHFIPDEKTKLAGIEDGAQKNTITGVKGGSESTYRTGNVNITKSNIGLGNVNNTSDANKPVSTAQQAAIDSSLSSAKSYAKDYTDTAISNLINSAPETLDTLGEIATAMAENKNVVEALDEAILKRALASDLTSHTGNKSNPHEVTLSQLGVKATATELNIMEGVTATKDEINILDGITVTTEKLNFMKDVTSNVQTQLNKKSDEGHKHVQKDITDFPLSLKNPESLTIQGNGTTLANGTYDGSAAKTVNITASAIGTYSSTEIDNKLNDKANSSDLVNHTGEKELHLADGERKKLAGIANEATKVSFERVLNSGTKIGTLSINTETVDLYSETNTHQSSKNVLGNSSKNISGSETLTNGNVYLKHLEDTSETSKHLIKGTGIATVTAKVGEIDINVPAYLEATSSDAGLMSSTHFSKVNALGSVSNIAYVENEITANKNGYKVIGKADTGYGLVHSSSNDITDYTECRIKDGKVYYKDTNTTYAAGDGISIGVNNEIINTGVLKVEESGTNGKIKVNNTDVSIHGLGSAAFTNRDAYLAADTCYAASETVGGKAVAAKDADNAVNAVNAEKADEATKLSCGTIGGTSNPVYFKEGVPVACGNLSSSDEKVAQTVLSSTDTAIYPIIVGKNLNNDIDGVNKVSKATLSGTGNLQITSLTIGSATLKYEGDALVISFS